MAVCAIFVFRIVSWEEIQEGVAFDVVGLYGAVSAIAVGLPSMEAVSGWRLKLRNGCPDS